MMSLNLRGAVLDKPHQENWPSTSKYDRIFSLTDSYSNEMMLIPKINFEALGYQSVYSLIKIN